MLEQFVRSQIEKKAFPGMSILVAGRGHILLERHFGCKSVWPEPEPLASDTLYDLASLTKPLVTAFLAVYLLEKKQWHLGDEVRRFFLTFPLHITLEQLLTHSAGLVPWHPFYLYQPLADLAQIAALKNMAAPGIRVLYSDVGYILLRRLLEKTVGLEFQKMAAAIIFKQLKLQNTFFLVPDAKKTRCAPTEIGNRYERNMCRSEHEEAAACFSWRTQLLRGEVHDANSFYSGGSALAKLAIGHNGFTGTSLWLEPETQR